MKQFKSTTKINHIVTPFIDYYNAETKDDALSMWQQDAIAYGIPDTAEVTIEEVEQ
jgi:hypothetical protein